MYTCGTTYTFSFQFSFFMSNLRGEMFSMMMHKFTKGEPRGQVLIVIMIALVGIIGIAGLAIDGGNTLLDRRSAQNAADSAALAGAIVRVNSPGEDWVGAVISSAAQNGYNNDGVTSIVEVYSPPKSGPYAKNVEYAQVIITSHVRMYFANVIGRSESINVVEAVIRTKAAELKPLLGGAALVSLAPTSECNRDKAFWVYQEGTFDVSGGNVFINSNSGCALIQEASGSIYMRYNDPITVVGGVMIHNYRRISPVLQVGAAQLNYPPPFIMPDVNCNGQASIKEDGQTMTPGSWSAKFPPVGVKHLEPGVYCLRHGFETNKETDLRGKDVVIKVVDGEVTITKNAKVRLSAPTTGKFTGLLFFVPMDNNKRLSFDLSAESEITGTILAPASNILFKGNDSRRGFHSQIIGYRIALSGDESVFIVYNPDENYHALTNSEIQLIK